MAISTKVFDTDSFPVPNEWIFETFLSLGEKLEGQTVAVKSVFNKNDTKPSLNVYLHENGKYKFKCFSSGLQGDGVDLIQWLYKLPTRNETFKYIYDLWKEGGEIEFDTRTLVKREFTISDYKIRSWNSLDVKYWSDFKIGSRELEYYNIRPLESYVFTEKRGEETIQREFTKPYCYGFFTKDGILYKIYNPKDKRTKFIKVKAYIKGHDQLKFEQDTLMILSSLKDVIDFRLLKFPVECVAPDSENVMITPAQMEWYRKKYKNIVVLFDNDVAGRKSSIKYQEKYNTPYIELNVEKDVADCVKEHGIDNTRIFLKPKLSKIISGLKQA